MKITEGWSHLGDRTRRITWGDQGWTEHAFWLDPENRCVWEQPLELRLESQWRTQSRCVVGAGDEQEEFIRRVDTGAVREERVIFDGVTIPTIVVEHQIRTESASGSWTELERRTSWVVHGLWALRINSTIDSESELFGSTMSVQLDVEVSSLPPWKERCGDPRQCPRHEEVGI